MEKNNDHRLPSAPDGRHTLKALVVAVGVALGTAPLSARAGAMLSMGPELVAATRAGKDVADQKAWPAMITAPSREPLPVSARREMVFIDPRVLDYEKLLARIDPGAEVVVLDESKGGLRQIAAVLAGRRNLGSIHLISHGEEGVLLIGGGEVREKDLGNHRAELQQIGAALAPVGDLLLYGCDVAKGPKGHRFIDRLAQLTGADVAASNNRTGAEGDWELEIKSGNIEARPVLAASAMAGYDHSLATLTVTSDADSGAGTLRQAITDAAAGDTITFDAPMTIQLSTVLGQRDQNTPNASLLLIGKDLTINGDLNGDGTPDVTLDGQNLATVLRVGASHVTLEGLTITGGLSAGGGGLGEGHGGDARGAGVWVTSGAVTIVDSAITGNHASGGGGFAWSWGTGGGGGGWGLGEGGISFNTTSMVRGTPGVGADGYGSDGQMGGHGGSSGATGSGGAGGIGESGYFYGGAGGTAGSAALGFIGGGGGGATWGGVSPTYPWRGGNAAGAMYIAPSATVYLANTAITDNLAAGGGGNSPSGSMPGDGGMGVGGIDNRGTLHYEDATVTRRNNFGAGGQGGGRYYAHVANGSGSNTGDEWLHGNAALNDFDPVAPTVRSIARHAPANAITNADSLTFEVTFSEPVTNLHTSDFEVTGSTAQASNVVLASGSTWEVTVSGGDLASVNGDVTLGISSGQGLTDMQGKAMVNTTPSGSVESYTLDNVATVSITAPAAAITDTQPTFSGTTEPGAAISVTLDGVSLGAAGVDSAGNWSLTAPTTLALGSHSVTIDATDALGNSGSTTENFTIYPPIALVDANGATLPSSVEVISGLSYAIQVSGGSGQYTASVLRPDGTTQSLSFSAGTFNVPTPTTGAFAGQHVVTLTDTQTGASQQIVVNVPLKVVNERSLLLSRDPLRREMELQVRGAAAGTTAHLALDSAAVNAGITLTAVNNGIAADDTANGNPARFTITLPDDLAAEANVSLTADDGALNGTGTMQATPAVAHPGQVFGPTSEMIANATVTLLHAIGTNAPQIWEDELGRITATTDATGHFTLLAPPQPAEESYSIQVTADGYAAGEAAAENCTDAAPCVLTLQAETTAATPTFTPPAGSYEESVLVTLESTTVGATLRYTLDGTTPSPSHGIEVANGTAVQISASGTIKVIAYKAGLNLSEVSEGAYVITPRAASGGGGAFGLPFLMALGGIAAFLWRRR